MSRLAISNREGVPFAIQRRSCRADRRAKIIKKKLAVSNMEAFVVNCGATRLYQSGKWSDQDEQQGCGLGLDGQRTPIGGNYGL